MVTAISYLRGARLLLTFVAITAVAALLGGDRNGVNNWTILADALLIVFASVVLFVMLPGSVHCWGGT